MSSPEASGKKSESILHKDIKDLELTKSLRQLGSIRVTEWEFSDVLPAVNRLAHKEVDLVDVFKRTANYLVTDWDFRDLLHLHAEKKDDAAPEPPGPEEMRKLIVRFTRFLGFVTNELIEMPDHAKILAAELEPGVLRFKLVLVKRDAAALIGHGGHSAAAIRRLMKDAGRRHGVHVLLQVLSHEEEAAAQARE
ncbi:MAG TPA: hypothetical protein VLO11_13535 [Luteolibacter sp.]|nr:hypothetical protein [Luteolibacter sp.]